MTRLRGGFEAASGCAHADVGEEGLLLELDPALTGEDQARQEGCHLGVAIVTRHFGQTELAPMAKMVEDERAAGLDGSAHDPGQLHDAESGPIGTGEHGEHGRAEPIWSNWREQLYPLG